MEALFPQLEDGAVHSVTMGLLPLGDVAAAATVCTAWAAAVGPHSPVWSERLRVVSGQAKLRGCGVAGAVRSAATSSASSVCIELEE